ncbi:MAG: hypothetical protein ACLQDL_15045 [Spirochaetia bacterium]
MRNKFILSVLLLFAATGLLWAQFWKDYSDADRQRVGESYWLAGKQYQAVGKTDKGGQYMALAKVIYPQLDPSAITDTSQPSAAELLAQGRTTTIGAGANAVPSGALDSFFLRFVSSLVEKDAAAAAGFLDGSIYLTKIPAEVTRADAQSELEGFFKEAPLAGLEPSAVYDLNTAVIAPVSPSMQKSWGETYTYTVTAKADYSTSVSFWDMKQQFFIHKVGADWYILAEGQDPPPLTWSPQKAEAAASQPPAGATDADARKAIADAFDACMGAILNKDADGALSHMSDNIRFMRLQQTVTKDELKTSLMGYFDNAAFAQTPLADALDLDSVFVQPADSPVDGVTGTVYELNVQSKEDLSSRIPFWSAYQKYYFVQDGGEWLIFAIL